MTKRKKCWQRGEGKSVKSEIMKWDFDLFGKRKPITELEFQKDVTVGTFLSTANIFTRKPTFPLPLPILPPLPLPCSELSESQRKRGGRKEGGG